MIIETHTRIKTRSAFVHVVPRQVAGCESCRRIGKGRTDPRVGLVSWPLVVKEGEGSQQLHVALSKSLSRTLFISPSPDSENPDDQKVPNSSQHVSLFDFPLCSP